MKLFGKWLVCLCALAITVYGFPESTSIHGGFGVLIAGATILFIANLLLRPLLQLIAFPVTIITFGIFSLIVNAWMVALTDTLLPSLRFANFWLCIFCALLISVGNTFFLFRKKT